MADLKLCANCNNILSNGAPTNRIGTTSEMTRGVILCEICVNKNRPRVKCSIEGCENTWIDDPKFTTDMCSECSLKNHEKSAFNTDFDGDEENILPAKPDFVPFDKEYKCANKDCTNTWIKQITEPIPILICGGHARVCPTCESQGYTVGDGQGDGLFRLFKDDEHISTYNYETAYKIVRTVKDVDECILGSLVEGYAPCLLDSYSQNLLKEWFAKNADYFEKDEYRNWYAPKYAQKINNYCLESSSFANEICKVTFRAIHAHEIPEFNPDAAYFEMECIESGCTYMLKFNLKNFDIDFDDFDDSSS